MPNIVAERFIHVMAAVIRHPERPQQILITRRKKGQHLENLWEFPGGKLEPGETRFHALKRELTEELGIQILAAAPLLSVRHKYPDRGILLDVWEVTDFHGSATGMEDQELCWVSPEELSRYEFPEADQPVITALSLPPKLLITPDLTGTQKGYLEHFERLMTLHPYARVLFRSHNLADDVYSRVARQMQKVTRTHNATLVISRPGLTSLQARSFKAFNCIHLNSISLQALRENPFAKDIRLSASCHDAAELRNAERLGCDFALLSTVRDTPSHPGRPAKGWSGFAALASRCRIPVYALGGVRRRDLCVARYQGALGVAGISDFWTV